MTTALITGDGAMAPISHAVVTGPKVMKKIDGGAELLRMSRTHFGPWIHWAAPGKGSRDARWGP